MFYENRKWPNLRMTLVSLRHFYFSLPLVQEVSKHEEEVSFRQTYDGGHVEVGQVRVGLDTHQHAP